MTTTLNKDERVLINYDHQLIKNYEKFVKNILGFILEKKVEVLMFEAISCYAHLLSKLNHFNFE